jgi:adenine phosphoribosyltransferase
LTGRSRWIETGAQIAAAIRLVERSGGDIVGIAAIHMERNENTDAIRRRYHVGVATELRS